MCATAERAEASENAMPAAQGEKAATAPQEDPQEGKVTPAQEAAAAEEAKGTPAQKRKAETAAEDGQQEEKQTAGPAQAANEAPAGQQWCNERLQQPQLRAFASAWRPCSRVTKRTLPPGTTAGHPVACCEPDRERPSLPARPPSYATSLFPPSPGPGLYCISRGRPSPRAF